jgi:L-threonylcarbamoyladenylate synthase
VKQTDFGIGANSIDSAAQALVAGQLVAFPTETVYGLGADAENEAAVERIYKVKNRPENHPLIVHISTVGLVKYWAKAVPNYAKKLMADFWPGPMTIILPRSDEAKDFITGAQESVGLRIPNHQTALSLLSEFEKLGGHGVAAPSANRYGAVSPTSTSAVRDEIGEYLSKEDIVLEGEACEVGIESTIIDCTKDQPRILRPGAISAAMIEASTGVDLMIPDENVPRVSGSDRVHYSPKAQVIVGGQSATGEGLIAGNQVPTPSGVIRLAAPKTDIEFANQLYAALREADNQGLLVVRVFPPTGEGIATAIRDRITRSAAK